MLYLSIYAYSCFNCINTFLPSLAYVLHLSHDFLKAFITSFDYSERQVTVLHICFTASDITFVIFTLSIHSVISG